MKRIEAGSILLLKFPFADGLGYKRRPALILRDFEDGDVLVCRITSKLYKSEYDIYLDNWEQLGLRLPSVVRVHKMATLEASLIETAMGRIDEKTLSKIKELYVSII